MDLEPFVTGIKKTGYPLEYATVKTLLEAGWSVISNKYYLDKDENKPREVDVLAYRCSKQKDYDVFTVLLISCKKSEHSAWAFISRDINSKDPNADWEPSHFWTDYKPLAYATSTFYWPKKYHQLVNEKKVGEVLRQPTVEIFAFQEMGAHEKAHKGKGQQGSPLIERRPSGDSAIFGSVLSLMKAQSYEMSARAQKKRIKPAIYQFNLISLAETEFVGLHFNGEKIEPSEIDSAHYIARYIIEQQQTFARIFFVRSSKFADYLKNYAMLHQANCEILKEETAQFYEGIVKDQERYRIFIDDFKRRLQLLLRINLPEGIDMPKLDNLWFVWDKEKSALTLEVGFMKSEIMEFLHSNDAYKVTKKLLKQFYRYEGEFHFSDDMPF